MRAGLLGWIGQGLRIGVTGGGEGGGRGGHKCGLRAEHRSGAGIVGGTSGVALAMGRIGKPRLHRKYLDELVQDIGDIHTGGSCRDILCIDGDSKQSDQRRQGRRREQAQPQQC